MKNGILCGAVLCSLLFLASSTRGEEDSDAPAVQEAFTLALAKAYAKSALFTAGMPPLHIAAEGKTGFALHAGGSATFSEDWVDANHWTQTLQVGDFTSAAMRNDEGRPWVKDSASFIPLRASEYSYYSRFSLLSSTQAAMYRVSSSIERSESGSAVRCFSATKPTPQDGFTRSWKWCFETGTGLLQSLEFPLATRVVFTGYMSFMGKQEYTHVRATVNGLPILEMDLH